MKNPELYYTERRACVYTSDIHHPIQLSNIGERINIWTAQKEYPRQKRNKQTDKTTKKKRDFLKSSITVEDLAARCIRSETRAEPGGLLSAAIFVCVNE
jgi:hypothetical protein